MADTLADTLQAQLEDAQSADDVLLIDLKLRVLRDHARP